MTVETVLNGYIHRDLVSNGPVVINLADAGNEASRLWEMAPPVTIRDARLLQADTDEGAFWARHGFVLLPHRSAVNDWESGGTTPFERNEIARIYLPEIEAIVRTRLLPGLALEVDQAPFIVRRGPGANAYATGIHNDYGLRPDDYQEALEAFSTPQYAALWRARFDRPQVAGFMVINFWRAIYLDQPLRHMPLAVCEPSSVTMETVVPAALAAFAPSGKNTNQLSLKYHQEQSWWYYPGMTRDEVLAFKVFEFFKDGGPEGLSICFHTAFADPETPQDAPPRESCEHRVGVFILRP